MRRTVLLAAVLALAVVIVYPFRVSIREAVSALGRTDAGSGTITESAQVSDRAGRAQPAPPAPPAPTPRTEISIDPRRQQLVGVRTATARRASLAHTIRTVGSIRPDETRLADVNLKLDGWIRDLYVDYTGHAVRKGQPLFTFYSPELFATEQEYILAIESRRQMQSSQIADARERADQLVASARQRLVLWDVPPDEIQALEASREPHDAVVFRSPVDGVVMDKQAVTGAHVVAGQTLYTIADLSVVWVEADVYEAELPLVRSGGRAVVTLNAYPGDTFPGRIVYIYPYLDEQTRTNKVRVELANRGGRLKPGMYANVEISAPSAEGIVVPADAVLDSGTEQVVFIAEGGGYFEPRRVKAGRRMGADIEIIEGVKDGEEVATGATFFLDSESQLRASLQGFEAPPGAPSTPGAAPRERLDITLRSRPDPPRTGENQLEVSVKDPAGKPVDDAEVRVQFFMAAMPTMNMPAMRNEVKLAPAGGGVYRGTGQVMMAGRWDATVTVTRGGQRIASQQLAIVAR